MEEVHAVQFSVQLRKYACKYTYTENTYKILQGFSNFRNWNMGKQEKTGLQDDFRECFMNKQTNKGMKELNNELMNDWTE